MTFSIAHLATWLGLVLCTRSSFAYPSASRAIVVDDTSRLKPEYDYILIGGGTSGLVVANRLTENPGSM